MQEFAVREYRIANKARPPARGRGLQSIIRVFTNSAPPARARGWENSKLSSSELLLRVQPTCTRGWGNVSFSDGLGWTRTGGTAGAGVPLNADSRHMASERNFAFLPDSSHMADSRRTSGRQSAGAHKISSTAAGSWREQQATRLESLTSFRERERAGEQGSRGTSRHTKSRPHIPLSSPRMACKAWLAACLYIPIWAAEKRQYRAAEMGRRGMNAAHSGRPQKKFLQKQDKYKSAVI